MHSDWYALTSNDRLLHAGAFNWTYTLGTGLLDPWSIGATAIVLDYESSLSDLPHIIKILVQHYLRRFPVFIGDYWTKMKNLTFPN